VLHQYTLTCAPLDARRTSSLYSISLHVFSNVSVPAAKASFILAFKLSMSGTGVEYPHKNSRGVTSGERGGHGVGPSFPIHRFGKVHPRIDENVTPSVAMHHPVGDLPMTATILRCSIKLYHVQVNDC
jgi:hypothetical protein